MEMPFGKYRGCDIGDVPDSYLEWVIENCEIRSEALYDAIESKLDGTYERSHPRRRTATAAPPPPPPPPPPPAAPPRPQGGELVSIEKVIRAWHRLLAKKYHPDRRGTHEQMLIVNEGAELLKQLAGLN